MVYISGISGPDRVRGGGKPSADGDLGGPRAPPPLPCGGPAAGGPNTGPRTRRGERGRGGGTSGKKRPKGGPFEVQGEGLAPSGAQGRGGGLGRTPPGVAGGGGPQGGFLRRPAALREKGLIAARRGGTDLKHDAGAGGEAHVEGGGGGGQRHGL